MMRMRPAGFTLLLIASLLTACSSPAVDKQLAAASASVDPGPSNDTGSDALTPEAEVEDWWTATPLEEWWTITPVEKWWTELPNRADQEGLEPFAAQQIVYEGVLGENTAGIYGNEHLRVASASICDAVDDGVAHSEILAEVEETLPRLESTDAKTLVVLAAGYVCPEHAPN